MLMTRSNIPDIFNYWTLSPQSTPTLNANEQTCQNTIHLQLVSMALHETLVYFVVVPKHHGGLSPEVLNTWPVWLMTFGANSTIKKLLPPLHVTMQAISSHDYDVITVTR